MLLLPTVLSTLGAMLQIAAENGQFCDLEGVVLATGELALNSSCPVIMPGQRTGGEAIVTRQEMQAALAALNLSNTVAQLQARVAYLEGFYSPSPPGPPGPPPSPPPITCTYDFSSVCSGSDPCVDVNLPTGSTPEDCFSLVRACQQDMSHSPYCTQASHSTCAASSPYTYVSIYYYGGTTGMNCAANTCTNQPGAAAQFAGTAAPAWPPSARWYTYACSQA